MPFSNRIYIYINVLITTLLAITQNTQAQEMSFNHLTVEQGLSQSTVFSIAQDVRGMMWFATRDGLNRYDARQIEVFRHDPFKGTSISNNTIYTLLTDSHNKLWIGTRNGLNVYDPENKAFIKYFSDPQNATSLSNNNITCLYEDHEKNLWVGTRNGLNLMIVKDTLAFVRFLHKPEDPNSIVNNDIRSIFQDSEGNLWVGTSLGFSKLVRSGYTQYTCTSFHIPGADTHSAKSNWVNTITEDSTGRLWIGTEKNGLVFFDKQTNRFLPDNKNINQTLGARAVRILVNDKNGNCWIGTIGGLFIVQRNNAKVLALKSVPDNASSLSDNSVRSIFFDRDGSAWIGTFHGGVNFFSPLSTQFHYLKPGVQLPGLDFRVASALEVDANRNLWIGTEGHGLLFIDRKHRHTIQLRHQDQNKNSLSHDNIKCLLLEENKGLWIGTLKGLNYYDFKKKKFTHYHNNPAEKHSLPDDAIYDIKKNSDGTLCIATYRGGLVYFNQHTGKVEQVFTHDPKQTGSMSSAGITTVFRDSKQNLWVGTINGLNKKSPNQNHFTNFRHVATDATSLGDDYVLCIFEDAEKNLWIGTRGGGLNKLPPNGKAFHRFTVTQGLAGNTVYGILQDDKGYLWISTENGLSQMDIRKYTFRNYDRTDGLVCKEFNFNSYEKDTDGFLYFGGYNGVAYFHPDSIRENKTVPPLSFTSLKLFNRKIEPRAHNKGFLKHDLNYTAQLAFTHDQNVFTVEFAVLNYINPQKNQFAYRLEGFESQWNKVKEPVATYMNLKPGHYTLQVRGANNDGVWNETPLTMTIEILPPPWKTWWAYAGYCSIFFALLYTWTKFHRKEAQLQHELQLEHLEKQKQQELHQSKVNFFTNIAHEIRTPLTLMSDPLDQLLERHTQDNRVKKELLLVKNNTDRLMRLLNQLLDFQRQETGNLTLKVMKEDVVEYLRGIVLSFSDFAAARNVVLQLQSQQEHIPLWFDRDEMAKVFCNLLVNAFKFTPGGGYVKIIITQEYPQTTISSDDFRVKIVLEDNGLGIAPAYLDKIFHRFYQAENSGMQEAGFGIGLSLTKGIVELHHGSIQVESQEASQTAQGFTRFMITLRGGHAHFQPDQLCQRNETISKEELVPSPPEGYATSGQTENPQSPGTLPERTLILVVEDNVEIREYIAYVLRQHSYIALESGNGQEAWNLAVEKLPDLIISDVMMPALNGLEFATKLKRDARTNHIPVILLTGRTTLNHQVEGLSTGAEDYLTKPFSAQLLLLKIRNHLASRKKLKEKYGRIVTLQPQTEVVEPPEDKFLQRLMQILDENVYDPSFNVAKLSHEIGMSRPVLFRKTKMLTGLSIIDLIRSLRLKKAEMLLKQGHQSVSEIAFAVGFSDPKHFSKSFREQYGKSPSLWRDSIEG